MASHRFPLRGILRASACSLLLSSGCQSTDGLLNWRGREDRKAAQSRQQLLDTINAKSPAPTNQILRGSADEHARMGQSDLHAYNKDKQRTHLSDARAHYEECLRQSPNHLKGLHGLAIVSDLEGRYSEAEKNYLQALSLAPNDSDILGDLGYSYLLQNRLGEAEQYCQRAIQANNSNEFAIHHLGDVYAKQGKLELARSTYLRVMTAEKAELALAEFRNQKPVDKALVGAPRPSLVDQLIPGPSRAERLTQDLQQRKADLEKQQQQPAIPPSLAQAAMARGASELRDGRSQQLKDELSAIDQEPYRNSGHGAIMIDTQTGQAQHIPGTAWPVQQQGPPTMLVEANIPPSGPQYQPSQQYQQQVPYVQGNGVPPEYHQAQPLNQFFQAGGNRAVAEAAPMGSLGGPPQRMLNAAGVPGYAPDAGQARAVAYGPQGNDPRYAVQQALLQNPVPGNYQQPQPYRGASPYYELGAAAGPGPQQGYPAGNGQQYPNSRQPQAAIPPGLNAALNAAGPQGQGPGAGLNAPQNGSGDAFQDASRAAARMGMGLGSGDIYNNAGNANQPGPANNGSNPNAGNPNGGAALSQYPGQGTMGQNYPVPQPDRHLPTNLVPPDLSQAYNQNPQSLGSSSHSHGGQQAAPNLPLYSQDQFGTRSRYDERTLQGNGVPPAAFNDPNMQAYEAQRWQAGQQFNQAVGNIWGQGPVNSPNSPTAGSVYSYPHQMGQAPGYTPGAQQPYGNQFGAQWPAAAPNQFPQGSLSGAPQMPPSNAQYSSGPAQPPQQQQQPLGQGQQQPNAAGYRPQQSGDPNVVVPQQYNPNNRAQSNGGGAPGAVNYQSNPYNSNGSQYSNGNQAQPGFPLIRPAPR